MISRTSQYACDRRFVTYLIATALLSGGCTQPRKPAAATAPAAPVRPGIEAFVERPPAAVIGKRIGLITNHTGIDRTGRSDIELLRGMSSVKLVA